MANSFRATLDELASGKIELDNPFDTRVTLVPNCECEAEVTDVSMTSFESQFEPGEMTAVFELIWTVVDPKVIEETHLDRPRGRQRVYLETTKGWDGKGLPPLAHGPNKNVAFGRLLEGFGFNKKGGFKSWTQFIHERKFVRFQQPKDPELANMSDVVAVGKRREDVMRPSDRKRTAA